jgi:hypothetical protein
MCIVTVNIHLIFSALLYSTRWCCDRHGDDFNLSSFFLGPMSTENVPKAKAPRAKSTRNRPVVDRIPLRNLLRQYRLSAHNTDPLRNVRPASFILDNAGITALTKVHPNQMKRPGQVVDTLRETNEWADMWSLAIFDVIYQYDNPFVAPIDDDNDADDGGGADVGGSECKVDVRTNVPATVKRTLAEPVVAPAKCRRRENVVVDASQLRRSSRPVIATRRYDDM